jgi:aminopeptidase-like protein
MVLQMNMVPRLNSEEFRGIGEDMYRMIVELYPICRSITGNGYRQTIRRIQEIIPISIQEVPSGTEVFDWTIPKEWNIRDAYVTGPDGKKVIDFKQHNLHIMQYSVPIRLKMPLEELKHHLYSLPDHPE